MTPTKPPKPPKPPKKLGAEVTSPAPKDHATRGPIIRKRNWGGLLILVGALALAKKNK